MEFFLLAIGAPIAAADLLILAGFPFGATSRAPCVFPGTRKDRRRVPLTDGPSAQFMGFPRPGG